MKAESSRADKFKSLGQVILNRNMKDETRNQFKGIGIREVRATLILLITIVLFLTMWIPSIIAYIVLKGWPEKGSLTMIFVELLLYQLNSMVNPFFFARTIKDANVILTRWSSSFASSIRKLSQLEKSPENAVDLN